MQGFQTATHQKRKGYANGGMVRGPGTGTSDDIEKTVKRGSFIMPADSTEEIGEKNLDQLGFGVPVNVSNGEYELPPEQVHAVGVQALEGMKGATHQPVGTEAQGFNTEHFFADGGLVDDERNLRSSKTGDPMAKGTPMPAIATPQAPAATPLADAAATRASAGLAPMTQVNPGLNLPDLSPHYRTTGGGWRTESALAGTSEDVADQMKSGQYARGFGTAVRGGIAAIPAAIADAGEDAYNLVGKPTANFARGFFGIQDGSAATPTPAATPTATPVQPTTTTTAAAPAVTASPTPQLATATPAAATTAQASLDNDVTRVGNSFSGKNIRSGFTVNGGAPDLPTAASDETVTTLAATTPALFGGGAARGFNGGTQQQGGPSVTFIPDSSQEGNQRRALMDAATTPYAGAQGGQLTANQLRTLQSSIEGDDRNSAQRYQTDAGNATALQREQMNEQGALQRALINETGANTRAAANTDLDRQRVAGETEARGFQNRAAQRLERLNAQYEAAKPEERAAIAQQMRDLSGREPANRFTVVPGGQEIDPSTQQLVTRPASVLNNTTGEFVGQRPQAAAAAPKAGEVRSGYRFKGGNPAEQKNWEKT